MNDCDVLRQDLQKELAAAYQLMDDREYAAAALCFRTASGHASQLASRLGGKGRRGNDAMTQHYYYLHTNGDLIGKPYLDGEQAAEFRESPFVRMFWLIDTRERYDAWRLLVEAKALGARDDRVDELAAKWRCDDKDAQQFADYLGLQLEMDGTQWCAKRADFVDLQSSPAGFGPRCLDAVADLLKNLEFQPSKTWGHTVEDLCRVGPA